MFYPEIQNHFKEFEFVVSSMKGGSYAGIFLLSTFVSYLLPLPEAVLLLLFGSIAFSANLNVIFVFLASFLGSIFGDNMLYRLSYFGNAYVERFNCKMRKNRLIQYEHLVTDNISKTIYFLRLITGVRFFGPVISGTLGISWKKFFGANLGATFLHTAMFVFLGYFFHRKIIAVIAEVEIIRNVLFFSSTILVGFILSCASRKKCKAEL